MEMKTIRQIAEEQGVSYEAVRRQVSKYRKELKGHISTKGKTKYLDEYAAQFISNRRRESPVVVLQQDTSAELDDVRSELEVTKAELERMKTLMLQAQERIINLQDENTKMITLQANYNNLLESNTRIESELDAARQDLKETNERLQAAEKEANSYEKSIFGFYRKRG